MVFKKGTLRHPRNDLSRAKYTRWTGRLCLKVVMHSLSWYWRSTASGMIRRGRKRRSGLADYVATRLLSSVVANAIDLPYRQMMLLNWNCRSCRRSRRLFNVNCPKREIQGSVRQRCLLFVLSSNCGQLSVQWWRPTAWGFWATNPCHVVCRFLL